jgi:hypothetical protein
MTERCKCGREMTLHDCAGGEFYVCVPCLDRISKEPPAATFSSVEELFEYLDGPDEVRKR